MIYDKAEKYKSENSFPLLSVPLEKAKAFNMHFLVHISGLLIVLIFLKDSDSFCVVTRLFFVKECHLVYLLLSSEIIKVKLLIRTLESSLTQSRPPAGADSVLWLFFFFLLL